jgi:hypothetical protein
MTGKGGSMKRNLAITTLALLIACAVAFGQGVSKAAYKGGFLVSGQAGASLVWYDVGETDARATQINIDIVPRALYFLTDGLGVGIEAGYDYSSYRGPGNSVTSDGFAIGPRIAYYIVQTEKKYPRACCLTPFFGPGWWMPFAGVTAQYVSDSLATGWRARIGAGISPLIGDRGTMPIEVGYEMQNMKAATDSDHSSSRVYLEVGFGAFLFK